MAAPTKGRKGETKVYCKIEKTVLTKKEKKVSPQTKFCYDVIKTIKVQQIQLHVKMIQKLVLLYGLV